MRPSGDTVMKMQGNLPLKEGTCQNKCKEIVHLKFPWDFPLPEKID